MNINDLTALPTLSNFTEIELQHLVSLGREININSGEIFIEEGAEANSFFILVKGRAEVRKNGDYVAELNPGEFLGEMALFNKNVRVSELIAMEPVVLLEISTDEFWKLVLHQDQLAVKVMQSAGASRPAKPCSAVTSNRVIG